MSYFHRLYLDRIALSVCFVIFPQIIPWSFSSIWLFCPISTDQTLTVYLYQFVLSYFHWLYLDRLVLSGCFVIFPQIIPWPFYVVVLSYFHRLYLDRLALSGCFVLFLQIKPWPFSSIWLFCHIFTDYTLTVQLYVVVLSYFHRLYLDRLALSGCFVLFLQIKLWPFSSISLFCPISTDYTFIV